jgi:hypothetical protein
MILYIVLTIAALSIAVLLEFKVHKEDRKHIETCPMHENIPKHKDNCRRCRIADWLQV